MFIEIFFSLVNRWVMEILLKWWIWKLEAFLVFLMAKSHFSWTAHIEFQKLHRDYLVKCSHKAFKIWEIDLESTYLKPVFFSEFCHNFCNIAVTSLRMFGVSSKIKIDTSSSYRGFGPKFTIPFIIKNYSKLLITISGLSPLFNFTHKYR